MRHKRAGRKFGRTSAHKKALFRNQVTSLILNDRIETTLTKAKELRRWADKMITLAKKNTLHARRQAMEVLKDPAALTKLFSTLVDRFKDRKGGYTRIMKLGNRHGDAAPMAIIEYLTAEAKKAVEGITGETKATGHAKAAKKAPAKKAAPAKKVATAKKAAPAKKAAAPRRQQKTQSK